MDQVEEMMEGLALDESSFYWYVDLDYEFDACQFYDFSVEDTEFDEQEVERWFKHAREYPPAPYMVKINLEKVLKSTHAKVHATPTLKTEVVEHKSPTITTPSDSGMHSSEGRTVHTTPSLKTEVVERKSATITTPSDCGMHSSEGRTQDVSDMKYHNLLADIENFKARFKSANKLSKPNPSSRASTTFMKPTASHLAKKINSVDMHGNSCGRSPKVQTPTGSETEDTKRQKLEIGFLRKVSQLKHQTSFSHKTTTKATVAQTPILLTEERARRRRSQKKVEANNHMFKAIPLNRKILESPSLLSHKKSMAHSCVFQKFHFKYDN